MTDSPFPRVRVGPVLLAVLFLTAIPFLRGQSTRSGGWRSATVSELKSLIPPRAPVVSERIETELRSASGITDGEGHSIAGVVLITAGYSAEGKYSHYFVSQVPVRIGDTLLAPGQYLIGWSHGQDRLNVTFYEALTGKPVAEVEAVHNPSITRVEQFRIWPPQTKPVIQLGRFTFSYSLADPLPSAMAP